MKTLFICLGNVARSQMAEAYFNHLTQTKDASSAGTLDFTPAKYGHPIQEVITVMREEGINVSAQIVKQVTPPMVNQVNQIIVLCKKDECPAFVRNSPVAKFWQIKDPFATKLDNFRNIRDQIKAKVINLIAHEKGSVTINKVFL